MASAQKQEFPPMFGPGFHPMAAADLRERCVAAFPLSRTRERIMAGLACVLGRLDGARIAGELWIDGSFLTQKIDPEDADVVLRVPGDLLNRISPEQQEALDWYLARERWNDVHCDTYLLAEHPPGHPLFDTWDWDRAYWVRQFGFSRGSDHKGIAVVRVGVPRA